MIVAKKLLLGKFNQFKNPGRSDLFLRADVLRVAQH